MAFIPNNKSQANRYRVLLFSVVLISVVIILGLILGAIFTSLITRSSTVPESQERSEIKSIELRILVDGSINITEIYKANSHRVLFKHGLLVNFQNNYSDEFGNSFPLNLTFNWVKRNGVDIPWSSSEAQEGLTTYYLGDKAIEIEPGWHEFMFNYTLANRIAKQAEMAYLSWELAANVYTIINGTVIEVRLPAFVEQGAIFYAARVLNSAEPLTSQPSKVGYLSPGLQAQVIDAAIADPSAKDTYAVRFQVKNQLLADEKLVIAVWWPAAFMKQ